MHSLAIFAPLCTDRPAHSSKLVVAKIAILIPFLLLCNHLDFGVDHLVELAGKMNFPWLMSNVRDKHTGGLLAEGERKIVLEWKGKKVSKKERGDAQCYVVRSLLQIWFGREEGGGGGV